MHQPNGRPGCIKLHNKVPSARSCSSCIGPEVLGQISMSLSHSPRSKSILSAAASHEIYAKGNLFIFTNHMFCIQKQPDDLRHGTSGKHYKTQVQGAFCSNLFWYKLSIRWHCASAQSLKFSHCGLVVKVILEQQIIISSLIQQISLQRSVKRESCSLSTNM